MSSYQSRIAAYVMFLQIKTKIAFLCSGVEWRWMSAEKSERKICSSWDQLQYASDQSRRHQLRSPDSAWRIVQLSVQMFGSHSCTSLIWCVRFLDMCFSFMFLFVWQNSLCILPPSSIIYKLRSPPDIYIYIISGSCWNTLRVGIRANVR